MRRNMFFRPCLQILLEQLKTCQCSIRVSILETAPGRGRVNFVPLVIRVSTIPNIYLSGIRGGENFRLYTWAGLLQNIDDDCSMMAKYFRQVIWRLSSTQNARARSRALGFNVQWEGKCTGTLCTACVPPSSTFTSCLHSSFADATGLDGVGGQAVYVSGEFIGGYVDP